MPIEKIMSRYSTSQLPEIEKWIEEWVLDWSIQTICDVRKHVESILWEWVISNDAIIDWIILTWWVFTNRPQSDTWDMCYVNLDDLLEHLSNENNQ